MTISVLQEAPGVNYQNSGTTVVTPAFGTNCTVGSTIEFYVGWASSTAPTQVQDSAGQTYTLGTSSFNSSDGYTVASYYFQNNASATKLTITATWAASQSFTGCWGKEIGGAAAVSFQTS